MRISLEGIERIFSRRLSALSLILFLLTFLLVGCDVFELNSSWRDREITIDGSNTDWLEAMMYFEKENVSLGLLNDENFIYICMIAEDQFIRTQVMMQGFSLWFDPDGGKKKIFGIKFPLGLQPSNLPKTMRRDEQNLERFPQAPRRPMNELEILGPGKDEQKRMPIAEAKGIDIIVKVSSGMLVYELKVPLIQSEQHPYAVRAEAGSLVGIGLETSKIDWKNLRREMGEAGARMGGMRGGGGRMPQGMRPQMPKPLKIWAIVQLASNNNAHQE